MSLSFYEVSVEQYLQMLGATQHILRTAEAHADTGGIDLGAIVNFRLQDDMHPFSFQVVSTLASLLRSASRDARWFV